jgi:hypothetical protein
MAWNTRLAGLKKTSLTISISLTAVATNPVFPVLSLEKYLSVLNRDCDFVWPKTVEIKNGRYLV